MLRAFFTEQSLTTESNPILLKRWDQSKNHHIIINDDDNHKNGIIVLGPEQCAKTSLLFQYAYNLVRDNVEKDSHFSVMVISATRSLSIPIGIQRVENDEQHARILTHIKMKYLDSSLLLSQYLANIHLLPMEHLPRFIFIANFSNFFASASADGLADDVSHLNIDDINAGGDTTTTTTTDSKVLDATHLKVLGLLHNTMEFLAQKFTNRDMTKFVPSFIITDKFQAYPFYDRWCETVIKIHEYNLQQGTITTTTTSATTRSITASPTFCMQYAKINGQADPRRTKLVYQMTSGSISVIKYDFARMPTDVIE